AGARRSGNRYAELLLELPRLAAELSASADRDPGAPAARPSTGDRPERSSEPLRAGQGAAPTGDEPPDADPQPSSDSTLA
ncbi:MAG: hypothetical protein M3N52_10590, partial [Actinomycetota bacterium]|nr:hypothetical protein [Actinomycetota bacterium]